MYMMTHIQIYKGRNFYKPKGPIKKIYNKVIIFDLDETLGSFVDLEILWSSRLFEQSQSNFNVLLDLYPEFLRSGILNILDFLHYKKTTGHCYKMYIYTNNNLFRDWTYKIVHYLEQNRRATGLFDQVICAFKINDVIVEPKRTSHDKTYSDFIKCSVLPTSSEICFIDDKYFTRMEHDKVYYIQPRSYHHSLSAREIISRFKNSGLVVPWHDIDFMHDRLNSAKSKSIADIEIDMDVSKKLMYHLQNFFHLTTTRNKTQKMRDTRIGRYTRRRSRKCA
jgi:hypothetical protein